MQLQKTGLWLVVVWLFALGLYACADNYHAALIGQWTDNERVFTFTKTHICDLKRDIQWKYKIENGSIRYSWAGVTFVYAASFTFIDSDTLQLTGGTHEGTYRRVK